MATRASAVPPETTQEPVTLLTKGQEGQRELACYVGIKVHTGGRSYCIAFTLLRKEIVCRRLDGREVKLKQPDLRKSQKVF